MKILYQWALKNPRGWEEVDASEWKNLPTRPVPQKGQLGGNDNTPGWIRNVNVQGITCEGYDHIAIEPIVIGNDEGVKLTVWNDDPDDAHVEGFEDWVNEPQAIVWTILPLAPDPKHGMAINTRQSCIRYASGARYDRLLARPPQNTTVRPLTDFKPPSDDTVRHGVWLEQQKFEEHKTSAPQDEWSWMHWVDHLPASETEVDPTPPLLGAVGRPPLRRKLKEQRAQGRYKQAEHTITYYQRDTDRANGLHTFPNENALELTTGVSATETVTTNASTVLAWLFTTDTNQPNSADWPSGVYNTQWNCTAASAGVNYQAQHNTSVANGWARVNSTLSATIDEIAVTTGVHSGTGLKLSSSATNDQAAGTATDRFTTALVAAGDSHGDVITLQFNTTDSYADGPWTTETPSSSGEAYFIITGVFAYLFLLLNFFKDFFLGNWN